MSRASRRTITDRLFVVKPVGPALRDGISIPALHSAMTALEDEVIRLRAMVEAPTKRAVTIHPATVIRAGVSTRTVLRALARGPGPETPEEPPSPDWPRV